MQVNYSSSAAKVYVQIITEAGTASVDTTDGSLSLEVRFSPVISRKIAELTSAVGALLPLSRK